MASVPQAFRNSCDLHIDGRTVHVSCSLFNHETGRSFTFEKQVPLKPILRWLASEMRAPQNSERAGAVVVRDHRHGPGGGGLFGSVRNRTLITRPSTSFSNSGPRGTAYDAGQGGVGPQFAIPGFSTVDQTPPAPNAADPTAPTAPLPPYGGFPYGGGDGGGGGYYGGDYGGGYQGDGDDGDDGDDGAFDDEVCGMAARIAVGKAVDDLWRDVEPIVIGGWWSKAKKWLKKHRKEVTEIASDAAAAAASAAFGPSAAAPAKQLTTVAADVSYGDNDAAKRHLLQQAEQSTNPDVQKMLELAKQAVDASKAIHQAQAAVSAAASGDAGAAQAVAQLQAAAQNTDHPVIQAAASAVAKAQAKASGDTSGALAMMAAWG